MDSGERLEALERDMEQIAVQLGAVNLALQNLTCGVGRRKRGRYEFFFPWVEKFP